MVLLIASTEDSTFDFFFSLLVLVPVEEIYIEV